LAEILCTRAPRGSQADGSPSGACVARPGELACTRALGGRDAGYGVVVAFFFGGIKRAHLITPTKRDKIR
jgi:hypothetical protein